MRGISTGIVAIGLMAGLVACGTQGTTSSAPSSESISTTDKLGMANPWTVDATPADAGHNAGLDSFSVPSDVTANRKVLPLVECSHMEDLAQAVYGSDGTEVVIRKSSRLSGENLHGDYNVYAGNWTTDIAGAETFCAGDETNGPILHAEWVESDGYHCCMLLKSVAESGTGMSDTELGAVIKALANA